MKIKKLLTTITFALMLVFCGAIFAGCGPKVASIEVVNLPRVVVSADNTQPDWSHVSATVTFEDGTEKIATSKDLTFSTIDTTTPGQKEVNVNYTGSDVKFPFSIYVQEGTVILATITAHSGVYDGIAHNAVSISGTLQTDTIEYSSDGTTWTKTMPQYKDVGEYPLTVRISRTNYDTKTENVTVSITKAPLTITAQNKTFVYGETPVEYGVNYSGFVNGEDSSVLDGTLAYIIKDANQQIVEITSESDAGTYTIIPTGEGATNYDISFANGTLTISKATFDMSQVSWNYVSPFTFDGTQKTVALKNLPKGLTANYSNNEKIDAGTYTASVASFTYNTTNYNAPVFTTTCEWIINKAQNTTAYTITDYNAEYDGNPHSFTLSGLQQGDTVAYSTDNKTTWVSEQPTLTNVGTLNVFIKISRANHNDVEKTATIIINKNSEMGVTASNYNSEYDGNAHGITLTGTIQGDTVTYSTDNGATWSTVAPTYTNTTTLPIAVKVKIERANYENEELSATIQISKASLTITADNKDVVYNEDLPTFTFSYSGFVNGETSTVLLTQPTATCTQYVKGTTNAGTQLAIVPASATATNYDITFTNGTLTVTKAPIAKPTADTTTFTYTSVAQTYTPVDFDTNTMTISGNVQTNANESGHTVSVSPKSNYMWQDSTTNAVEFSFIINKLEVTLEWSNCSLTYTGSEQAPTATVSNLKSGDACTVTVTGAETNVGTNYTATASALSNTNYKLPQQATSSFDITKATNSWSVMPKVTLSASTSDAKFYVGEALFGTPSKVLKNSSTSAVVQETDLVDGTEYIMEVTIADTANYTGLSEQIAFVPNNVSVNNLQSTSADKSLFIEKTNALIAGDDNVFKLPVYAIENDTLATKHIFESSISLTLKGETDTPVQDNGQYVKIDNYHQYLYFTSQAVGNTFNVRIVAGGGDINFDVQVQDAYNVYTADDLCVIENSGINGWTEKKQGTIYEGVSVHGVAIQADINVQDSNLPSDYFFNATEAASVAGSVSTNQTIEGSMKDGEGDGSGGNCRGIYKHNFAQGETFNYYGNYYVVNFSQLTRCVVQSQLDGAVWVDNVDTTNETPITTHVTFIRFDGVGGTTNLSVTDARFIGNGARSARSVYSGGALLMKINAVNSNINNCYYSDTFIGFMYDGGNDLSDQTTNVLTNTQGYNCYNCLMYVYGEKDLKIVGGAFVGAGGPVMIVDHVGGDKTTGAGGHPSNITIIGTNLESFVTGNEPWFVSYGATALVGQIIAANAYYTAAGSTFLQTKDSVANMMNLKIVYKSSSAEGLTGCAVRGGVAYYNTQAEFEAQTGYKLDMTTYSIMATTSGNIVQNSYSGGILGVNNDTYASLAPSGVTNLNFYIANGMAIMLGLYAYNP